MSLSTFNTELDIFLLIFHIHIAVKSFKTITTGLYFCGKNKICYVFSVCSNVKNCKNLSDKNILLTVCSNHILAFSLYTGGLLIFQNFHYINHSNVIFCTS